MTTIGESLRPAVPIGQAVGQAEACLTRLLAGILAESGTSHETYLGLQRLTSQGAALRAGILGASAEITEPMLATLDRDDLETTVRTLDDITRRARGIPARPTTTEDKR